MELLSILRTEGEMGMTERDEIIKGLESQLNDLQKYADADEAVTLTQCRAKDIVALLKEQETVKPKKIKDYKPPMYILYEYMCEKCETPMLEKQPFCMGCGMAVKWNDG